MDFGYILKDLEKMNKVAKRNIPIASYNIGEDFKDTVKKHTPVDTGTLKNDVTHNSTQFGEIIYNTVDYAP